MLGGLLQRLGLHRRELRAWALYDWANSVFMTTVLQIFPVYFARAVAADLPAAEASERFAWVTTAAMVAVALLSPVLGAMADQAGLKKTMLAAFAGLGILATMGLGLAGRGDVALASALFVLANVGASSSIVFFDSLLPHVAREDEMDRAATASFALGYLGGGLLLALNLAWIQWPRAFGIPDSGSATRLSFISAGLWWAVFTVPLLRRVPEPSSAGAPLRFRLVGDAFARLGQTLRELRGYRDAFLLLLAFLVYSDGIGTIIRLAPVYGTELGIPSTHLLGAILMVQFVAVPCSFLFGWIAGQLGARRTLFIALAAYVGITVVAYSMKTTRDFFVLAALVALVQGGSQALSRSLFASLIPRQRSAEFFGFFGVFEKFGGVLGPAVFGAMVEATGSSRPAVLVLSAFFVVGGVLLARVDVERGRLRAREAEARA